MLIKNKQLLQVFVASILSLTLVVPVLAAAPADGGVEEGERVPGIALGDTRAEVESSIGAPRSCASVEAAGDFASCTFDVEGGGQVSVRYRGPDGGDASNSPDDIVRNIRWNHVEGWFTTAGINTTIALNDPQAVVDAYPNAQVTYHGDYVYSVRDPELGIDVLRSWDFYGAFTTVTISIFSPYSYTPPPPQDMIRVTEIDMVADRRSVTARVLVLDDQDQPVESALVQAAWSYPKVNNLQVSGTTASDGYAIFKIEKARRGNYYLNITDVSLEGFVYDYINSTTLGVVSKAK